MVFLIQIFLYVYRINRYFLISSTEFVDLLSIQKSKFRELFRGRSQSTTPTSALSYRQRLSSVPSRPHIRGEMPQMPTPARDAAAGDGRASSAGKPGRPDAGIAAAPSHGARKSSLEQWQCRRYAFAASRPVAVAR